MDEDGLPLMGSGIDLTKVPAIQQKRTVAFLNQFVVHTVQFLNRFSTVCEEWGGLRVISGLLKTDSLLASRIHSTAGLYSPELAEKLVSCLLILDNEQQSVAPPIYHHVVADSISSGFEVFWFRNWQTFLFVFNKFETTLNILDAKLSSIPGLEDVTVEVSPLSVTAVPSGSHSESPPEQPQQDSTQDSGPQESEVSSENIVTVAKDPRYARYLKMVQVGVPVMAIRNKMISEGLDPELLEKPDAPVPNGASEKAIEESSDSESSFSD